MSAPRAGTRIGDRCSGHECWPPRHCTTGSSNVFMNGIGAHRQGDEWETHCCGTECHDSYLAQGSSTVFVNGLPKARQGDPIACGSAIIEGSSNVFCGG